jgi:hypothetical protein
VRKKDFNKWDKESPSFLPSFLPFQLQCPAEKGKMVFSSHAANNLFGIEYQNQACHLVAQRLLHPPSTHVTLVRFPELAVFPFMSENVIFWSKW